MKKQYKYFVIVFVFLWSFSIGTFVFGAPTSNITRTLLPEVHNTYDIGSSSMKYKNLYISGTCTGCGGVSGITANYVPKALTSTSLTDSLMYDDGTGIGIGTITPRGLIDLVKVNYLSAPTSPVINFTYNDIDANGDFYASGYSTGCRVYTYKTISGNKYFSLAYAQIYGVDNASSDPMEIHCSWTAVAGADGYRVYFDEQNMYIGSDFTGNPAYYETTSTSIILGENVNYIEQNLSFGPIDPTPNSYGPDLYMDSSDGTLTSTGNASFANIDASDVVTAVTSVDSPVINLSTDYRMYWTNQYSTRMRFAFNNNNLATPADFVVEFQDEQSSNAGDTIFQFGKAFDYGMQFIGYGSGVSGTIGNNSQGIPRAKSWWLTANNGGANFVRADTGDILLGGNSGDALWWDQSAAIMAIYPKLAVGGGTLTPTAKLHLGAGTTAASNAPLKFTSGSLETTAEAGAVEFLTDKWYATITTGAARKELTLNDAALTSGRVPIVTTNGRLSDDSDLTFSTDTLTGTKLVGSTSITDSGLTSGRVTFAGTSGILSDDADMTFSTDTLSATKVAVKAGTSSGNVAKVGGTIFDHFADATVGGSEADIYTDTTIANTFGANGDKVTASFGGNFVTIGTELTQLKVYFAGTAIWDSTGVAPSTGTTSWNVDVKLIRVSSTVVRYTVTLNTTGASGFVYATAGELTGLTLSGTNILKITGTSSGVGSGSGDIVGKMGFVEFKPAM